MKTQKIIKMGWFMGFMIVLCLVDVFAATSADELYQKAISEIEQRNIDAAIPLLDAVLACDDANDILRMNIYKLRARLIYFENPESAKSDCNSAIMIAKSLIAERLKGNTNLSQDYLITACNNYGGTLVFGRYMLCKDGIYRESAAINQSYSADVLKLGPFFDVNGRRKIVDFAIKGWREAAHIMIDAKQIAEAHNIYENAEGVLDKLTWTTPEMTEKAVYTVQMGALITSDVNDQAFGAAAVELIEKNKTKSWIVDSSIDVTGLISSERLYELFTALINAQPTAADDHSMALLYRLAYTTSKEVGRPEEAVIYYKTLKQKYPNESVSALP
jgi:tetratricopeptide (TPR) repeat protein